MDVEIHVYIEATSLSASSGKPMCVRASKRYSSATEGKAALKSNKITAPSIEIKFETIDLPLKNPCWCPETHVCRIPSHQNLAACASNLLSVLTTASGRVASGV